MINAITIILPDNHTIKDKLKKKLSEYEKRVEKIKNKHFINNPDLSYNSMPGYKALITRRLYANGEVRTMELAKELREEFGNLDFKSFNCAARVIKDYCVTGGKNVINGTGF